MNILLVEDDLCYGRLLSEELQSVDRSLVVRWATSRASAITHLQDSEFDLIFCDLQIPTVDGGLDKNLEHGLTVLERAREMFPGTPIVLISAFGTISMVSQVMRNGDREDVFGSGKRYQLVDFVEKSGIDDCVERVRFFKEEINTLQAIEIVIGTNCRPLNAPQKHILRVFTRRMGGTSAHVDDLSGLSQARTLRVRVADGNDTIKALTVAKIDTLGKVNDEYTRYKHHVAPLISVGGCTPYSEIVLAGAGASGGLFYRLAEDYNSSLYSILGSDPDRAVEVIPRLQAVMATWREGPHRQLTVEQIRSGLVADSSMKSFTDALDGVDRDVFEAYSITVRQCVRHRDLHGFNILVSSDGIPLLIDYADVGLACGSLDPLTLELGTIFHPDCVEMRGAWPSIEAAQKWAAVDDFTAQCPFASFIKACRQWAEKDSAGKREVYANAYAYCMRQLKYKDIDPALARAIARSAIDAFQQSY